MNTLFHFSPSSGWLNDPNGLIEHHGVHHLFFQHNPHELAMRDMCWGHATSTDLLAWTEQPIALTPGPGSYDEDGCWSGCAVPDGDSVVVIYSGNKSGVQLPCLARALDDGLVRWEKSADNPVIPDRPPVAGVTDMRDHSVRWDGERWRQVVAGGASGVGMLFAYSSPDLIRWSWDGIFLRAVDASLPGQVWECPDVFEADGQLVAIISVVTEGRPLVIWVTGPAESGTMRPRRWGVVDFGDRFYAPQSYRDQQGRRIMFGWLRTQADPATKGDLSTGNMSLPRIVTVENGRLHQTPAAELRQRRGESVRLPVSELSTGTVPVASAAGLEIGISTATWADLQQGEITLCDDQGHSMTVDLSILFAVDTHTGPDSDSSDFEPGPPTATIIFDCGIVEAFAGGRAASYSDASLRRITSLQLKGVQDGLSELTIWPLTGSLADRT